MGTVRAMMPLNEDDGPPHRARRAKAIAIDVLMQELDRASGKLDPDSLDAMSRKLDVSVDFLHRASVWAAIRKSQAV